MLQNAKTCPSTFRHTNLGCLFLDSREIRGYVQVSYFGRSRSNPKRRHRAPGVAGTAPSGCKLLPVKPLGSSPTSVAHTSGARVRVYYTFHMPTECKLWNCRWLTNDDTANLRPPETRGYVICKPAAVPELGIRSACGTCGRRGTPCGAGMRNAGWRSLPSGFTGNSFAAEGAVPATPGALCLVLDWTGNARNKKPCT